MIIRRESLNAVLPATASDDSRYFLQSIQCEPELNRVVSTNGHVLLIATDRDPMKDEDFPTIAGAEFHGNPAKPVLVPADVARSMIATMPKRSSIPILGCAQLSMNGTETTATIAATDLLAPRVATIRDDNGKFPSYDRVIPKADRAEVQVTLSIEVLETLIKACKAVSGTGKNAKATPAITFSVPIGRSDIAIEYDPKTGDKMPHGKPGAVSAAVGISIKGIDVNVTGVAMPCRL